MDAEIQNVYEGHGPLIQRKQKIQNVVTLEIAKFQFLKKAEITLQWNPL